MDNSVELMIKNTKDLKSPLLDELPDLVVDNNTGINIPSYGPEKYINNSMGDNNPYDNKLSDKNRFICPIKCNIL